jgi:predicted RNase H-like HicB family nuclease
MASIAKILLAVLSGRSDANIRFESLRHLVKSMGFVERIKGGHFIYTRSDVVEIINLQRVSMKYEIIIYWSEADGAFIAEVPELPGCSADGSTKAKALVAVEKIAREWIETAKELGRPVPEPKGRLVFA